MPDCLTQSCLFVQEFNVAVLVVNQVMADPGANSMFGPVMKPVGQFDAIH